MWDYRPALSKTVRLICIHMYDDNWFSPIFAVNAPEGYFCFVHLCVFIHPSLKTLITYPFHNKKKSHISSWNVLRVRSNLILQNVHNSVNIFYGILWKFWWAWTLLNLGKPVLYTLVLPRRRDGNTIKQAYCQQIHLEVVRERGKRGGQYEKNKELIRETSKIAVCEMMCFKIKILTNNTMGIELTLISNEWLNELN